MLSIMPRTAGVSSRVRRRPILLRPSPIRVCCYLFGRRCGLAICSTVSRLPLPFSAAALARYLRPTLSYLAGGVGLTGRSVTPARHDFADLLAAPRRHRARVLLLFQRVEGGAHHIIGIGAAK